MMCAALLFNTVSFCLPDGAIGKRYHGRWLVCLDIAITISGEVLCPPYFVIPCPLQKAVFPRAFPPWHGPEFIPVSP